MSNRFYDTDLTDTAWSWVAPVLPAARPGGRPRTTNLRAVLNAILFLPILTKPTTSKMHLSGKATRL
jgi:transposase